ncbi:hypothetical protein [Saccharopolyspora spinosa]|uniref:Uncharacterized protein n=1 Tax=Saccharopolyspora spinosa TaxID=60894 RepID=A0A2N3XSP2_SACSN|nr:hypothetical protein [Saccharopolyspora spinosa]PKW13669.1 hypothetical protein A8926_1217 [Saccharopolyspora spinosa]
MTDTDRDLVGELHRYLVGQRGWIVSPLLDNEIDDDGVPDTAEPIWDYPQSYRAVEIHEIAEAGPQILDAVTDIDESTWDWAPKPIKFNTAGNVRGCEKHDIIQRFFPMSALDDPTEMSAFLDEAEAHARELDPRELIECRFFGPCG